MSNMNVSRASSSAGFPAVAPVRVQPHGRVAAAAAELLYCLIGFAPAIAFFVGSVTLICVGAGLAVIYVGVPVLALGLLFARAGGAVQRGLARSLLGTPVPAPAQPRYRRPGLAGLLAYLLLDAEAWRAVGFHCIRIVVAPVQFGLAVGLYSGALGGLSYPLWYLWLPAQQAADGSWHRGAQWWPDVFVDTPVLIGVQMLLGLMLLLMAPAVLRAVTTIDRVLVAALLGPRPAIARDTVER